MENKLAITKTYDNISQRLISDACLIYQGQKMYIKNALWDTGADITSISANVVVRLGLRSKTYKEVMTPIGLSLHPYYILDLAISDMVIRNVKMIVSDIAMQGVDLLIGMDIISQGDLAITNYNGQTMISFRIPSQAHIDFTKE